jgi:catechol 2,3-dioxygenase-like lactoylglutathione lyase family enzyme
VKDFEEMMAKMKASAKIVSINQQTRQFFALFPGDITVEFTEDKSIDVPVRHHHIHFATPAEDDMRTWYGKVFGAVPGMRGRFKAADLPGVNLTWKPADQPTAPTKGRSMDHIGFEVTDVAAMCSKAEGAGARIDLKPTTRPDLGLTIAFLTDPWGTSIELTEGLAKIR